MDDIILKTITISMLVFIVVYQVISLQFKSDVTSPISKVDLYSAVWKRILLLKEAKFVEGLLFCFGLDFQL